MKLFLIVIGALILLVGLVFPAGEKPRISTGVWSVYAPDGMILAWWRGTKDGPRKYLGMDGTSWESHIFEEDTK